MVRTALSVEVRCSRSGRLAAKHACREIAQECLAPPVHALCARMDAFGGGGIGIVDPPVGMHRGARGRFAQRRWHGGELADWPSRPGKSLRITYGHTLASRGEKRNRSTRPSLRGRGRDATVEDHPARCARWSCRRASGRANSTTPNTSAWSASVVSRSKTRLSSVPDAHEFSAPARLRRVLGRAVQQVADRRAVAHLDRALELRGEVIAERAAAGDVRRRRTRCCPTRPPGCRR